MREHGRGFTLVELLIVMTITSILILGMNAAYRQAHHLWVQVEGQRGVYTFIRILSETLRAELSGLYIPPASGGQETPDIVSPFRLATEPDGAVELAFFTLTPAWQGSVESSRIARVRYRFLGDRDQGRGTLERFEQLCAGGKVLGQETHSTVASDIAAFQLWVLDPEDAREPLKAAYESGERAPKAIKMVITWSGSEEVPENSFELLIQIPCDERLDIDDQDEG